MIPTGPSIDRALRNKAIIEWVTYPILHPGHPTLPGTRNTLPELAAGYASFLGCNLSEVMIGGDEWLFDSDLLDFIADRYMGIITRWYDLGL